MALDTAIRISGLFNDELGTNANSQLYAMVDSSIPLGTIATHATSGMLLLAGLSGAHLREIALSIVVPELGLPPPLAGARVEQCGLFNFSNDKDPRRWAAVVPALQNHMISQGKIDLGNPDVQDFINDLIAVDATFRFTSPQGHNLVALLDAIISYRKKRRQLQRTSFEV